MRENRLNRQPSGRGRSTQRTRTSPSSARSAGAPATPTDPPRPSSALGRAATAAAKLPRPRRIGFTRRALILFGVLAVLGLSFAGSLRVWVVQNNDLATARAQIEQRTARESQLRDELERMADPAFVKAQARTRLGWVMPGDVGYRVVDADGHVLSGTEAIEGIGAARGNDLEARWWDRLAVSMRQADEAPPVSR